MSRLPGIQQRRRILIGPLRPVGRLDLQRVRGRPQQVDAGGLVVVGADIVFPGGDIVVVTVLLVAFAQGHLGRQLIGDAEIDNAVDVVGVVLLEARAELRAELAGGLACGHIDQATDGVPSEQCALGAAQHFHAGEVDAAQQRTGIGTEEDVVHRHADGGVEVLLDIRDADTANKDGGHATGALGGIVDDQVGRNAGQVHEIPAEHTADLGLVEGADGQADILQIFLTFTGSYNDFLKRACFLRGHWQRQRTGQRRGRNGQSEFLNLIFHCLPPG